MKAKRMSDEQPLWKRIVMSFGFDTFPVVTPNGIEYWISSRDFIFSMITATLLSLFLALYVMPSFDWIELPSLEVLK